MNKRVISFALCLSMAAATGVAAAAGTVGDISGDGVVNVTDLSMAAGHVKGVKSLDDEKAAIADVNSDGTVNVSDISLIAAHIKNIRLLEGSDTADVSEDEVFSAYLAKQAKADCMTVAYSHFYGNNGDTADTYAYYKPVMPEGLIGSRVFDFDGDGSKEMAVFSFAHRTYDLSEDTSETARIAENGYDIKMELFKAENGSAKLMDSAFLSDFVNVGTKQTFPDENGEMIFEKDKRSLFNSIMMNCYDVTFASAEKDGSMYFDFYAASQAFYKGGREDFWGVITVKDGKFTKEAAVAELSGSVTCVVDMEGEGVEEGYTYYGENDVTFIEDVRTVTAEYGFVLDRANTGIDAIGSCKIDKIAEGRYVGEMKQYDSYKVWFSDFTPEAVSRRKAMYDASAYFGKDSNIYVFDIDDDGSMEMALKTDGTLGTMLYTYDGEHYESVGDILVGTGYDAENNVLAMSYEDLPMYEMLRLDSFKDGKMEQLYVGTVGKLDMMEGAPEAANFFVDNIKTGERKTYDSAEAAKAAMEGYYDADKVTELDWVDRIKCERLRSAIEDADKLS